jgi:hypothetical protein
MRGIRFAGSPAWRAYAEADKLPRPGGSLDGRLNPACDRHQLGVGGTPPIYSSSAWFGSANLSRERFAL